MAGAGERHIGEAELLASLLREVLPPAVAEAGAFSSDVDGAAIAGRRVVEHRGLPLRDPTGTPEIRAVDDRELEALARVDGEDLHRFGVGLEAPAAILVVRVLPRLGDPPPQPRGEGGGSELLGRRLQMQELADVAQIGELPFAVGAAEHPPRQSLGVGDRLEQRRDAPAAEQVRPRVDALVDLLPGGVVGRRHLRGRPAEEARQRRGPDAGG